MKMTIKLMKAKANGESPEPAKEASDEASGEKAPDKYDIENWARTLMDAEEIKKDPAKMKHVQPHLEKKATAIKSIADLKKKASNMS